MEPQGTDCLDLIWGGDGIAKAIDRTPRATFGMLEKGELPARKVNGRWVASRKALVAFFEGHGGRRENAA